jgi:mitochondrial pyruvate carrier 2
MKWAIVLAGVSDFFRPPEKLSLTQNLALTATGSIWTRWCFIIKPKNYLSVLYSAITFSLQQFSAHRDWIPYRLDNRAMG